MNLFNVYYLKFSLFRKIIKKEKIINKLMFSDIKFDGFLNYFLRIKIS